MGERGQHRQCLCWLPGSGFSGQWVSCELEHSIAPDATSVSVRVRGEASSRTVPKSWVRASLKTLLALPLASIWSSTYEQESFQRSACQDKGLVCEIVKQHATTAPARVAEEDEQFDFLAQIAAKRQLLADHGSTGNDASQGFEHGGERSAELRIDPVDGLQYSLEDFLVEYGEEEGHLRWDSAGIVPKRGVNDPPESPKGTDQHTRAASTNSPTCGLPPNFNFAMPNTQAHLTKQPVHPPHADNDDAPENSSRNEKRDIDSAQIRPRVNRAAKPTSAVQGGKKVASRNRRNQSKQLSRSQLRNKNTKLVKAAKGARLESVAGLLKQGAQVNFRESRHGYTALHQAAWHGALDVVQYLVGKRADLNIRNHEGENALAAARDGGHATVIEFLEQASPSTNATSRTQVSAQKTGKNHQLAATIDNSDGISIHSIQRSNADDDPVAALMAITGVANQDDGDSKSHGTTSLRNEIGERSLHQEKEAEKQSERGNRVYENGQAMDKDAEHPVLHADGWHTTRDSNEVAEFLRITGPQTVTALVAEPETASLVGALEPQSTNTWQVGELDQDVAQIAAAVIAAESPKDTTATL